MQLFARDFSGATLAVDVNGADSCADACAALCNKAGVPCAEVRLVFEGKQLDMDCQLADYSIEAGACPFRLSARRRVPTRPGPRRGESIVTYDLSI